jgi:hypothetical protein
LTRGQLYYRDTKTGKSYPWGTVPDEVKDVPCVKVNKVQQSFKPPHPPKFDKIMEEIGDEVTISNCVTNVFNVQSSLQKIMINEYHVEFDPPIDPTDVEKRNMVVLGRSSGDKRKNGQVLNAQFGEWIYDNHFMYGLGDKKAEKFEIEGLHRNFTVRFTWLRNYWIHSDDCTESQEIGIMNAYKRKLLIGSKFIRIGKGWYDNDAKPAALGNNKKSTDPLKPDVEILHGIDCQLRLGQNENTIITVGTCCKLMTALTVHDLLRQLYDRCNGNMPEFEKRARSYLEGKYGLTTYNKKHMNIGRLDFKQNEHSQFHWSRENRDVCYGEYIKNRYGVNSRRHEICVIVDEEGSVFLPQHVRLTVRTADLDSWQRKEMHRQTNPSIPERIKRSVQFVHKINEFSEENNAVMRIDPRPINVNGVELAPVFVKFKNQQGMARAPAGRALVQAWKGMSGVLDNDSIGNGVILFGNRDGRAAENFARHWAEYAKQKNSKANTPLGQIKLVQIDNISQFERYGDYIDGSADFVIGILPDGILGSKMKVHLTRACQLCCKTSEDNAVLFQGMQAKNCAQWARVYACIENILAKAGSVLYEIDPNLRTDRIPVDSMWAFGLDVVHSKGEKPSVACLSVNHEPLVGSLRYVHHHVHLQPPKTEVVPFDGMVNMVLNGLDRAWTLEMDKAEGDEKLAASRLPRMLWVFRDGVSEGELRQVASKELAGLERAIHMFKDKIGLKKWKPQVEWVIAQKDILTTFGTTNGRGPPRHPVKPTVIFDSVLSTRVWDTVKILSPNPKSNPIRYVFLKDKGKLRDSPAAIDAFQFIYSLTWAYAFSVPFSMGNCRVPAPIKYASHYATYIAELMLNGDQKMADIQLHESLNRPHLVTKFLDVPCPDITQAIDISDLSVTELTEMTETSDRI